MCGLWEGIGHGQAGSGRYALPILDVAVVGILLRVAGSGGVWVGGVPRILGKWRVYIVWGVVWGVYSIEGRGEEGDILNICIS